MRLDALFLTCGALALAVAVTLALGGLRAHRRPLFTAALLCALFGSGLLMQAFAPHLEIEGDKFVVPERDLSGKVIADPIRLVERDRRMKLWSALLLSISAAGLLILYREPIFSTYSRGRFRIQSERGEAPHN